MQALMSANDTERDIQTKRDANRGYAGLESANRHQKAICRHWGVQTNTDRGYAGMEGVKIDAKA
jgi:hypothetical protein